MEMNDIVLLGLISCVFSAVFSVLFTLVLRQIRDFRVSRLENEVESLRKARNADATNEKKVVNKEQEAMFMMQASEILKEEGDMKDKIMKVVALNPAMALRTAKKLGLKL